MNWHWSYMDNEGVALRNIPTVAAVTDFPTQSDAENYIGSAWRELLDAGIDAVVLYQGERMVYGPMSLHPPVR